MCREYESSYANPEFRNYCDFVSFTESNLVEIATTDLKEGRQWSLPTLVSPKLAELCDQFRGVAMAVEPTPEEPISV